MPTPRKLKPKTEYQTGIALVRPGRQPANQTRADELAYDYFMGKPGPNGENVIHDIKRACVLAGYADTPENHSTWERILAINSKRTEIAWQFRGGITKSEIQGRVGMIIRGIGKYTLVDETGLPSLDFAAMKADDALFLLKKYTIDPETQKVTTWEPIPFTEGVRIMMQLMPGLELPKPGSSAENPLHVAIDAETDRIIKEYQETHPEVIEAEFTEESE